MHPFPPKPLYWETPESFVALHCVLNFLLSLAVLLTVAVVLLRSTRKARGYDIIIWFASGITLTLAFIGIAGYFARGEDVLAGSLKMMWIVVAIGSGISWLNIERKPRGSAMPAGIVAVPLIVIGFILVLILPPAQSIRRGTRHPCRNNLHQIGLALHNYHEQLDSFPSQIAGAPPVSWRVQILPYLGHEDLGDRYDDLRPWDDAVNLPIARELIPFYTCPNVYPRFRENSGMRFTSYAAVAGPHTFWQGNQPTTLNVATDGTFCTLLVVEACGQQIVWTESRDMDIASTPIGINLPGRREGESEGIISSYHTGGAYVLLGDGATRFISSDIDPAVLEALITADGGEEIQEF